MARLRDIKVGMTVWIKEGKTSVESFGECFKDSIMKTVGTSVLVVEIDPEDPRCTISAGDWWYPADWISLTPPKGALSKEAPVKGTPKEKLYVAYCDGDTTNPGTIKQVIEYMENEWSFEGERDILGATFYELTEVKIQYTPAKFEVVE